MAKKIKKQLREFAEGGISKQEFEAIMDATGASSQQIVKRMDSMNQNGQDVRLNSGAVNMLIRDYTNNPNSQYSPMSSYGDGQIGKSLTGMFGSTGYTAPVNSKNIGGSAAVAPQLMIGGTQIRKGGHVAVRKPLLATSSGGGSPTDATSTEPSTPGKKTPAGSTPSAGSTATTSTAPENMATAADTLSQSYEGMTGGGSGLSGAQGLRRAFSRWRSQNRGTAGTNNFRRFLQIGAPSINLN